MLEAKRLRKEQETKDAKQEHAIAVVAEQPANKPMSFAEKMALRKATEAAKPVETPVIAQTQAAQQEPEEKQKQEQEPSLQSTEAYSDIGQRINELASLSDMDLKNAMSELKKALMQNPSAVELMNYEDIGKMVIALNKITGAYLQEVQAPKERKSKKAKEPLSAEEIAAVFDEL